MKSIFSKLFNKEKSVKGKINENNNSFQHVLDNGSVVSEFFIKKH